MFYRIGDSSTSQMIVRHTVLNPMFTVEKLYARTVLAKRESPFKYNPYADPNRVQSLISSVLQSEKQDRVRLSLQLICSRGSELTLDLSVAIRALEV